MPQGASEEPPQESRNRERLILIILAAVQFTTIVDFMIVMPLGPSAHAELSKSARPSSA